MTPPSSDKLDSVIRRIHSSVGDELRWTGVLGELRELLRGRCAALAEHNFLTGSGKPVFRSPSDPLLWSAFTKEHSVGDPWFISSMEYRPGRVMTGEALMDSADLVRTDFYQRFLKRYGLFHWLCGVLARTKDTIHYIGIYRSKSQAAFDEHDETALKRVLGHLTVSLENHWELLGARSMNNVLAEVSDRLAPAVFIVDSGGYVVLTNCRSEEFLEHCPSLRIENARIRAASKAEDRALTKAIKEVADGSSTDSPDEKVVIFRGNAFPRPLMVSIRPAGKVFCSDRRAYRNTAILFAKNPDRSHSIGSCSFSETYRLTPAQARLVGLILSGHSRSDVARHLNVSENTVRSHLKQIYVKTETHGLMELVQLHSKTCTDHY